MSTDERVNRRVIASAASLAIHVSAVIVVLWLAGPVARTPASPPSGSASSHASDAESTDVAASSAALQSPSPGESSALRAAVSELAVSHQANIGNWLDHVWQSTLFALAAGLLVRAFRHNRARVRYCLWFSASVKFLIPFSVLTLLGAALPWPATRVDGPLPPALSSRMAQITQPFVGGELPGLTTARADDAVDWTQLTLFSVWACGFASIVVMRLHMWRRIRRSVAISVVVDTPPVALPSHVQVRMAPGLLEPGVVGFWRPVILLPADIAEHVTAVQLEAVLAHELCHVRRYDNFTAAVHMVIEAVFWFHPVVWWIGSRLVDERERACDEEVLATVANPREYAEAIVNVCKRYVDAPLVCVSGVSGSNLTKRIEAIMRNRRGHALDGWKKLALTTALLATTGAPVILGMLSTPHLRAQSAPNSVPAFAVASVRANNSGDAYSAWNPQPGGLSAINATTAELIRFAYDLPEFQVSGGPGWLESDRFDVLAKTAGDPPMPQKRLMLRKLLEERFKFAGHVETRTLPIYVLEMAATDRRLGPQLRRSEADCSRADQSSSDSAVGPAPSSGPAPCGFFGFAPGTDFPSGRGGLAFRGLTMAALAKRLIVMVKRSVNDQTGLSGYYDGDFEFIAELPLPPPPNPGVPSPFGTPFPSLFAVFPQQLGLKLDARLGPVEVLVIDRVERPTDTSAH